ncbi:hypothetical protein COEREDRAFT_83410 [Coemansia reversa NRRL 1564]|uniref:Protein CASP n=1 Tax=Coemansia reversa (strain ATCC 12441 / NRRL 1564) TaxID=763665 RepID=A0A2G5B3G5_COERN|nr:hypothetical protein COEREDRAFT_83410 [Coemansia reversa NRRL 1564]|eukprot:PIA13546.1 hypothetical protein COEREDRAFT_83410 [Coemansia reversa NRRL 1564]
MATEIEDGVLAGAHESWRSVALTQLLHGLDEAGLSIVDNQKTSLQERRKLAEKTKEFRAVPDSEKVTEFKPLLRAYQNEIDALTKRMKFAETSFLKLFKSLSEAPDPEPFLQSLLEERRVRRADEVQIKDFNTLKGKCEDLEKENAQLQRQIREEEPMAKRLKVLEENMEHEIKQRVEQCERELKEQTDDLIKHLKERESDLQRQLSSTTQQLSQAQSHFDSEEAERSSQSQSDRDLVGKLAELEILQADLDHAHSRMVDMQTQNAKLRATITSLTGTEDAGGDSLIDYQRRIRDLEDESKRLYANLEKADAQIELQKSQSSFSIAAAERDILVRNEELDRLRAELLRCGDYDDIKRDLDIMKSVEFSVSDWGMDDDNTSSVQQLEGNESLEKLLVRRNKSLENNLIEIKNRFGHTQNELQSLQQKITGLEEELRQKSLLAERLEVDLLAIGSNDRKSADNRISINPLDTKDNSIELQSTSIGKGNILEIVTGQRDRFRQRNIELEDELREQGTQISEHQRQLNQVNHDNLRLYEEIKYLRSYTSTIASTSRNLPTTVISLPNKFSSNADTRIDMDTIKYKNMYEDSLNPFNTFHKNETTRKVKSMGLIDRLVYMISSFIAANRRARIIVLFYIALLHLLVLGTLYRNILPNDEAAYEHVTNG